AGQEGASVGLYPIDRAAQAFGPPKSGRSLRQVFEQSKAKKAPGGEPGSGSGHEALVAEVEGEDGYETVTDDELPEEDELEEDVAENEQHNIEVTMRNLRMQTWRREVRRLVMERGKSNLRRLESALIRFTLGLTIEKDEPVFGMVPMHKTSLWYGRKFMAEEVPELLAEIDAGMLDINMLLETVSFYAQRLHESWFREPVLNVDHRGQVTTAARLLRDMERVYRAARVPAAKMQWSRSADFVSKAVCFLQHRHTAMDDGRVAVGCENGYVVVLSFD
ncbi:hypothetical protein GGI18_005031, partial [Coemansia linderi]